MLLDHSPRLHLPRAASAALASAEALLAQLVDLAQLRPDCFAEQAQDQFARTQRLRQLVAGKAVRS
jgi:hypothetical protein